MSLVAELTKFRIRQPSLSDIADEIILQYLTDADLEMPFFGISDSNKSYSKLLSLYTMHLLSVSGILKEISAESIKDVSASYSTQDISKFGSTYMIEFRRSLRRRHYPFYMMHNS